MTLIPLDTIIRRISEEKMTKVIKSKRFSLSQVGSNEKKDFQPKTNFINDIKKGKYLKESKEIKACKTMTMRHTKSISNSNNSIKKYDTYDKNTFRYVRKDDVNDLYISLLNDLRSVCLDVDFGFE